MRFYYKRDKGCVITVCEKSDFFGVGVGYSRCWHLDEPDETQGMIIAQGRAEKALRARRIGRFEDGSIKYEYWSRGISFALVPCRNLCDYLASFAPRAVTA